MKIEHLEERVHDYENSINTVVEKRLLWNEKVKNLIHTTLKTVAEQYDIGWKVQELSWIRQNEAVNITFDTFPKKLTDCTNLIPAFQFLPGGSLIFSQTYSGDIIIFILFPETENLPQESRTIEFGVFPPDVITEKMVVEMVDNFLKEMNKWEVPPHPKKIGY